MSETAIPQDIMAAAREAFRGGVGYPPDTPIADSALIIYIARAILAERERCAKIADAAVDGRSRQMSDANAQNDRRAARDFESMKFEAIEIAAAIRSNP